MSEDDRISRRFKEEQEKERKRRKSYDEREYNGYGYGEDAIIIQKREL